MVIADGKLQSFARPSYRIAVAGDVFHALDGGPGDQPAYGHKCPSAKAALVAEHSIDLKGLRRLKPRHGSGNTAFREKPDG